MHQGHPGEFRQRADADTAAAETTFPARSLALYKSIFAYPSRTWILELEPSKWVTVSASSSIDVDTNPLTDERIENHLNRAPIDVRMRAHGPSERGKTLEGVAVGTRHEAGVSVRHLNIDLDLEHDRPHAEAEARLWLRERRVRAALGRDRSLTITTPSGGLRVIAVLELVDYARFRALATQLIEALDLEVRAGWVELYPDAARGSRLPLGRGSSIVAGGGDRTPLHDQVADELAHLVGLPPLDLAEVVAGVAGEASVEAAGRSPDGASSDATSASSGGARGARGASRGTAGGRGRRGRSGRPELVLEPSPAPEGRPRPRSGGGGAQRHWLTAQDPFWQRNRNRPEIARLRLDRALEVPAGEGRRNDHLLGLIRHYDPDRDRPVGDVLRDVRAHLEAHRAAYQAASKDLRTAWNREMGLLRPKIEAWKRSTAELEPLAPVSLTAGERRRLEERVAAHCDARGIELHPRFLPWAEQVLAHFKARRWIEWVHLSAKRLTEFAGIGRHRWRGEVIYKAFKRLLADVGILEWIETWKKGAWAMPHRVRFRWDASGKAAAQCDVAPAAKREVEVPVAAAAGEDEPKATPTERLVNFGRGGQSRGSAGGACRKENHSSSPPGVVPLEQTSPKKEQHPPPRSSGGARRGDSPRRGQRPPASANPADRASVHRALVDYGITRALVDHAIRALDPRDLERWLVAVRDGFVRARTPQAVLAKMIRSALAGEAWELPEHYDAWRRERARAARVAAEERAALRAREASAECDQRAEEARWRALTLSERVDQVVRDGLASVRRHVELVLGPVRVEERDLRALLDRDLAEAVTAPRPPDLYALSRTVTRCLERSGTSSSDSRRTS